MSLARYQHESSTGTYVMCPPTLNHTLSPPSSPHPSGLSQSTGFGCPVLSIELALVIYSICGNICAAVSDHPTPAFSQSPKVCSLHLCLFCRPISRIVLVTLALSIAEYAPNLTCHVNPKALFTDFTVLSTGFHFYTCFSKLKLYS